MDMDDARNPERSTVHCLIADLPQDVLLYILAFANARDINAFSTTSKYFRQISSDESLWRTVCERDRIPLSRTETVESFKRKYFARISGSLVLWGDNGSFRLGSGRAILTPTRCAINDLANQTSAAW